MTDPVLEALVYMVAAQRQPFDHADRRASIEQAQAAIAQARGDRPKEGPTQAEIEHGEALDRAEFAKAALAKAKGTES